MGLTSTSPACDPRTRRGFLVAVLLAAIWPASTFAATPIAALRASVDVDTTLDGRLFRDHEIFENRLDGSVVAVPFAPGLDPASAVIAYHRRDDGSELFAVDRPTLLPDGTVALPRDLIERSAAGYAIVLAGDDAGLPPGSRIDAVSEAGTLRLSVDRAVALASGVTVGRQELMSWNGSALSPDPTLTGLPAGLDLDALHFLDNGHLLVSFDTGGDLGGVTFDDEDVLELDPVNGTWELAFDGGDLLEGADLDALFAFETLSTEIFRDGFESGDVTAWSAAVP